MEPHASVYILSAPVSAVPVASNHAYLKRPVSLTAIVC